jgi:hypothetical protein
MKNQFEVAWSPLEPTVKVVSNAAAEEEALDYFRSLGYLPGNIQHVSLSFNERGDYVPFSSDSHSFPLKKHAKNEKIPASQIDFLLKVDKETGEKLSQYRTEKDELARRIKELNSEISDYESTIVRLKTKHVKAKYFSLTILVPCLFTLFLCLYLFDVGGSVFFHFFLHLIVIFAFLTFFDLCAFIALLFNAVNAKVSSEPDPEFSPFFIKDNMKRLEKASVIDRFLISPYSNRIAVIDQEVATLCPAKPAPENTYPYAI